MLPVTGHTNAADRTRMSLDLVNQFTVLNPCYTNSIVVGTGHNMLAVRY